jgi:hypothetical protein
MRGICCEVLSNTTKICKDIRLPGRSIYPASPNYDTGTATVCVCVCVCVSSLILVRLGVKKLPINMMDRTDFIGVFKSLIKKTPNLSNTDVQ